mmetsp:Transcript_26475/g.72781  ORF Transcript_26475/g.72781 Transcript_26475/m.72781 type:complete len:266 (-) Transcript_26475:1010-1807(-)
MIGKSRRSHVDSVGSNGSGRNTVVGISIVIVIVIVIVGIVIGVVNSGSGPVGRGRWLVWVPVASDGGSGRRSIPLGGIGSAIGIRIGIRGGTHPDVVQDAPKARSFQQSTHPVVQWNLSQIGTPGDPFPLTGSIIASPLLVKISHDKHRQAVVILIGNGKASQQQLANLGPPLRRVKGIKVGSNHPAPGGMLPAGGAMAATNNAQVAGGGILHQHAEGRPIVGEHHFLAPQDLFAGGNQRGRVSVFRDPQKVIASQPQYLFQQGL